MGKQALSTDCAADGAAPAHSPMKRTTTLGFTTISFARNDMPMPLTGKRVRAIPGLPSTCGKTRSGPIVQFAWFPHPRVESFNLSLAGGLAQGVLSENT